ncbi:TerB family tellurite resistance protein [Flavisolibacter nicotianae]|uniref:TerB family tellurite resistance protein n=1 Tax=Flavisolibacter nicotianae TaxID=2364882 RepID=UPI000EB395A7|nr:TerB family tellurite resistance protein [Flavisolibacter nicotianae]
MSEHQTVLEGYSDREKGAYLGAIASLATADRQASEEELAYIQQLAEAAQLSTEQQDVVRRAATELSGEELNQCLDVLKNSQLKYSLVTDLLAFAKSDSDYSEAEEQSIHKISSYLGLNQEQLSVLDEVAQQPASPAPAGGEPAQPQALLGGGLQEKLQKAGINAGGLLKSVLSIAAPMLIGSMISRGLGRRGGTGGLGGALGGMLGGGGGLGGMLGGGGLGSLIGMLSGGGGMRSTGGLLGKILGGRGGF